MAFRKSSKETQSTQIVVNTIERCGVIGRRGNRSVELRYLQFGEHDPKYDLRIWGTDDEGEERCYKGISISGEELENLQKLLNTMNDAKPAGKRGGRRKGTKTAQPRTEEKVDKPTEEKAS